MTHIGNIPHILKHGITHKDSHRANPDYQPIGDRSLISFRESKKVPVTNGEPVGPETEEITLGRFIPFYFGVRTPMLYVIQKGGNFVPEPTLPEQIVYLVSSVRKIIEHKLGFYFSDGHATDNYTDFFDTSKVNDIEEIVDFNATCVKYWKNENDLDLKRRKEAELLVECDLPVSCLLGFICYNQAAKDILKSYGINEHQIEIRSDYYF